MNEMMQFMDELKQLCHKGEQIAQRMQGENFGQRGGYGRYGMRDNQSGYNSGGSNYGQRWDEGPMMHGGYPPQGGYQSQGQYPNINPMMFM